MGAVLCLIWHQGGQRERRQAGGTAPQGPGAVTVSWDPACGSSAWSAWASLQDGGLRTSDFVRGDQLWPGTSSSRLTPATGTVISATC